MTNPSKRKPAEALREDVQLQEIDERHFLSQQVFLRRYERGWSQERLAEEAGLTQAQVATLEAGQANPTLRTLVKIAVTFECTMRDLFATDDDADGCTSMDREGAEVLRELSRHTHAGEEGQNAEFTLVDAEPAAGARSGVSAFHTRAARRLGRTARALVDFDTSMELEEITETVEL